jgi:hypothetical protein
MLKTAISLIDSNLSFLTANYTKSSFFEPSEAELSRELQREALNLRRTSNEEEKVKFRDNIKILELKPRLLAWYAANHKV